MRFLVVGPEDDREYAEALREDIAAKGLSDAVRFLGERRGQDKLVCLGAADALVLPSHTENFGMVVPEALASGVPVVASQHTPWEGLRLAGVGDWLPLATEPWVEALTRWIGKDRADSERCREYARAEFAKDQVLRRLASMYRDLARSAPLSDGL